MMLLTMQFRPKKNTSLVLLCHCVIARPIRLVAVNIPVKKGEERKALLCVIYGRVDKRRCCVSQI
jgi:hypothetical protein